jgi:hypothetical protein
LVGKSEHRAMTTDIPLVTDKLTLSHTSIKYTSSCAGFELTDLVVIGTDSIVS